MISVGSVPSRSDVVGLDGARLRPNAHPLAKQVALVANQPIHLSRQLHEKGLPVPTTLYSVGAYDRFNYGDLLFPLVIDHATATTNVSAVKHLAVRDADMRPAGGVVVPSSASGVELETGLAGLIIGGGEVMGATWSQAFISLTPYPALAREVPVAFNAVGASSILDLNPTGLRSVLSTAAASVFASTHDVEGHAALQRGSVNSELAPDSVAIIAQMWPKQPHPSPRTAVFQCSQKWRWDSGDVVPELLKVSRQFDRLKLLPVGMAGGHGDQIALRSLQERLAQSGLRAELLVERLTVQKIAETIANADLFMGTSLHGAITSMAHGVPHVARDRVSKLSAYIRTWGGGLTPFEVPAESLAEAAAAALATPLERLAARAELLAGLSWANTMRVLDATHA